MRNIIIKNINQNNFHNISICLPKNKFIVITGPSGCGKSTLAIDIIYAEGQRKFIESLPPYARQFIPLPDKPNIDEAIGLTPSIVIDQKTTMTNTRSTVGTVSEIYDYIRTLYSTFGVQYCITCGKIIKSLNSIEIATTLKENFQNKELIILLPIKSSTILNFIEKGFTRFKINTTPIIIRNEINLKEAKIRVSDIIDVVLYENKGEHQLDIIEKAITQFLEYKDIISIKQGDNILKFTTSKKCTECKTINSTIYPAINQKLFSFNLPTGACPECKGIGEYRSYNHLDFDAIAQGSIKITKICQGCQGERLNQIALAIKINNKNIHQFCSIPIEEVDQFLNNIEINTPNQKTIFDKIVYEIRKRITLLINLGLGYLTLERRSESLSGGELQRIRLAGQLGSGLTGVTYILDEPSIGLHQSDNTKLIISIKKLRDLGNTIIVIEHDDETILSADEILDIGPGAGIHGGKIMFQGTPSEIIKSNKSLTSLYLNNIKTLDRKSNRAKITTWFEILNATKFNLKNVSVKFPFNRSLMTVISGISGSGKSTLIFDELLPQLENFIQFHTYKKTYRIINDNGTIDENIKYNKIIIIDQKPINGTLRSTVGTYFGFFDDIRELFSSLPESKIQGLDKGAFSFNTSPYRCKNCSGKGILKINMDPLPETEINCDICFGKRYTKNILNIKYNGKNIYDVLSMNIEEAAVFFEHHITIKKKLNALLDVGLSYLTLNQSTDTFSGGEAQRVKLADQLMHRNKKNMYILDEPTTGLHFSDIAMLLKVFEKLMEKGNSLIIIEHNMHIIRYADYIIDMGPGGGKNGGEIIATGTPEEIKKNKNSITGKYI